MSNDTDSSISSSSTDESKKSKIWKKHKKKIHKQIKKEKKEKFHKKERNYVDTSYSEEVSVQMSSPGSAVKAVDTVVFGPTLPPHLMQDHHIQLSLSKMQPVNKAIIGPTLPNDLRKDPLINTIIERVSARSASDEDDTGNSYGPMPPKCDDSQLGMTTKQIELEQRALELKLAAIDGIPTITADAVVREEWMLELPEVGRKSGLASLTNIKRNFHQGKERPDFSDRSIWTNTPHKVDDSQNPISLELTVKDLKRVAQTNYDSQRDAEQERIAKKHQKKHKRKESLIEIHQKKLRKEQKQREEELGKFGAKAERRPFSRDVDLKLNKIDKNQTKKIVDKAKILHGKFASGNTKYL